MQQLHLVGFTTDLEGLIFSARKGAKSGGYLVVLDDKLRATVEDAFRLRNGQAPGGEGGDDAPGGGGGRPRRPRPESTLSPREIQARLRSGSTIAEVAREGGVDEEWVSRFAVPIQAEQAQVVGRARRLTFVKPRLGESALPLGTAVRWNLADKGIRLFDDDYDVAWTAYNLQGASWVVRFEYASRQKRQVAEWEVDLREGELFARNRTASELGYVDAARRRRRPPALEPSPRETPARPVEPARSVAPAARRDDEAAPPAPARTPARRGGGTDAGARPAARSGAGGGRGAAPTRGRSAVKKAAAAAKGRRATAANKAGKATASRKAASAKRARPQKPAGKKRGSADHAAGRRTPPAAKPTSAAAKAASAAAKAASAAPIVVAALPDEPVRPSHLARPPSPMPTARRATSLPLHAPRPVPPRPVVAPERPHRPPPPPEPEAERDLPEPTAPAPEPAEPVRARPKSQAAPGDEPVRRVAGDNVRVLARPGRTNGDGAAAPIATAPRRRPSRADAPGADQAAGDTPERKLARRLASTPTRPEGGGRTRRIPSAASAAPGAGAQPEAEPMWHGPGSGEPAPTVRIRADLAAGTRRPVDPGEAAAGGTPAAGTGTGTGDTVAGPTAARTRRRERPLRAR
ncbi:MAG TPA: septation protein SepH [Acidimicrobiales bacterium]|nr:septation protein SepH [Acidimicrobiales bacterium]